MAFNLIPFDQTLANSVIIEFVADPNPISGFPTGPGGGSGPLKLQFPPKITGDSKSANWQEENKGSYEPLLVWLGSNPRKITIELTYIVDGNQFTTATIANITKTVKAYFYREIEDSENIPIVKLMVYNHMDTGATADFRLMEANIAHGETIIDDGAGQFPLFTKITITAALVTQVVNKQEVPSLESVPPPQWY